jgi:hypothetical protein
MFFVMKEGGDRSMVVALVDHSRLLQRTMTKMAFEVVEAGSRLF